MALVCPDENDYNAKKGPLVGEAGIINRIEYVDRAFLAAGLIPEYYEIPSESGCSA